MSSRDEKKEFQYMLGILAFNRIEFAKKQIESIKNQTLSACFGNITVLIDGFLGSRAQALGWTDNTEHLAQMFETSLPGCIVYRNRSNEGIARSFYKLRELVYAKADQDWCLFMEEDIVLHPRYLEVTNSLLPLFEKQISVAQLSCFWSIHKSSSENAYVFNAFGTKIFAEKSSAFNIIKNDLSEYIKSFQNRPYHEQDRELVLSSMLRRGLVTFQTQQDCVIEYLLMKHNLVHISTPFDLVDDIGKVGSNNRKATVIKSNKVISDQELDVYLYEVRKLDKQLLNEIDTILVEAREKYLRQLLCCFLAYHNNVSIRATLRTLLRLLLAKLFTKGRASQLRPL